MTDTKVVAHTSNLCTQENEVEEAQGYSQSGLGNPVSTLSPKKTIIAVVLTPYCLGTGVLQRAPAYHN